MKRYVARPVMASVNTSDKKLFDELSQVVREFRDIANVRGGKYATLYKEANQLINWSYYHWDDVRNNQVPDDTRMKVADMINRVRDMTVAAPPLWPDGKPARVNYGSENFRASMTRYDFMEALEDANIPYDSSAPTFELMELFDQYVVPMYEAEEDEY